MKNRSRRSRRRLRYAHCHIRAYHSAAPSAAGISSCQIRLLKIEKVLLGKKASGISRQLSTAAYHAVARYYERQRVGTYGVAHRTYIGFRSHLTCELRVRLRRAIRDFADEVPHLALEICSCKVHLKVERPSFAVEILGKLLLGLPPSQASPLHIPRKKGFSGCGCQPLRRWRDLTQSHKQSLSSVEPRMISPQRSVICADNDVSVRFH